MGLFLSTYSTETRLKYPQLYSQTQNVFNFKMFWSWIFNALFHSILVFWICLFTMRHEVIWIKGRVGDYSLFGNVIYTVGITKITKWSTKKSYLILFVIIYLEYIGRCVFQGRFTYSVMVFNCTHSYMGIYTIMDFIHYNL